MPSFLVNYGGPQKAFTSKESIYQDIFTACEEKYNGAIQSVAFTANGLDLTYYQVGIHRMLKVELPPQVEKDITSPDQDIQRQARKTKQLYVSAKARAGDFNTKAYQLLSQNCVTAVASLLNNIEPAILQGQKRVIPLSLDNDIQSTTLVQAMVDEAIRGDILPAEKQKKDYRQAHIPHEIWQDVMTPVGMQRQQQIKQAVHALANNETSCAMPDEPNDSNISKL